MHKPKPNKKPTVTRNVGKTSAAHTIEIRKLLDSYVMISPLVTLANFQSSMASFYGNLNNDMPSKGLAFVIGLGSKRGW